MTDKKQPGTLPSADRPAETAPGHWLLARLGKRVLRPGGLELTRKLLNGVAAKGLDVVEFAPGLGLTAKELCDAEPSSYVGVDEDKNACQLTETAIEGRGKVVNAKASETGLGDDCADVVFGEAMLTMQGEKGKAAIINEAARLLRPGGHYAIHELGLVNVGETSENPVPEKESEAAVEIRKGLARAIHVNARPLTMGEWSALLEQYGFKVVETFTTPMHLLEPKRMIQDEGVTGFLKIVFNAIRFPDARKRMMIMRKTFKKYEEHLIAVGLIAERVDDN